MPRFGPLTFEDWICSHALTLAATPGSRMHPLKRWRVGSVLIGEEVDPRTRIRFVRIDCPIKAGAPWLLARVDLDTGQAIVFNVSTRERFESRIDALAQAARNGAETFACQRWQMRHALRLRRVCVRLGMRLHACARGRNPLAGTGFPLNSYTHRELGHIEEEKQR